MISGDEWFDIEDGLCKLKPDIWPFVLFVVLLLIFFWGGGGGWRLVGEYLIHYVTKRLIFDVPLNYGDLFFINDSRGAKKVLRIWPSYLFCIPNERE